MFMELAAVVQDPTTQAVFMWLDSGVGVLVLIITVVVHAVIMGKWASRIEVQVDMLRVDMPALRQHRHDTAVSLAEHHGRLAEGAIRMDNNTHAIAEVRAEIGVLVRLDERIGSIQARLAKIEEGLDRRRDH